MEETSSSCMGCLTSNEKQSLGRYILNFEPLKEILKVDSMILCYLCNRRACNAENFIKHVRNQHFLLCDIQKQNETMQFRKGRPGFFTQTSLPSLDLPGFGEGNGCEVISGHVKMELEDDDNDDYSVKEESLVDLKQEITTDISFKTDDLPIKDVKKEKILKNRKRKIILVKKSMLDEATEFETEYSLIRVPEKQCLKEREEKSQDGYYLSCLYKCENCVKGYMHKTSYERHMTSHSLSRGDFVCDVCKQRFESLRKLGAHSKCHTYRYKCTKCDVSRISHNAIRRHFAAKHSVLGSSLYHCSKCPKVFKNRVSLRKHEANSHSNNERVTCDSCLHTFISKDTLLNHILRKHPTDGASDSYRKRHVCTDCGLTFSAPYLLRNHAARHTENRPYYCVECDRSFKTEKILTRHLKTASRHVFNADLSVSCDRCDKRFSCKRDLGRHVNSVHLNVRPYACDKCDRAYLNSWSLREHKMFSHEGFKKERRYPCTLCHKIFDRSSILKSHIRTHTGERPYHCQHCPSQFVQSSQLRTHTNLVHLKLTRDGKPKQAVVK